MKKPISALLGLFMLISSYSFGLELSIKDTNLVVVTTNKFEDFISKKGNIYRRSVIKIIDDFASKYKSDERLQTMLNIIKNNIKTDSNSQIQNKIIKELEKNGIPDLNFLYSTGTLENTPFLLNRLLDDKKQKFEKLLQTTGTNINFKLINQFNEDDNLAYLFALIQNYNTTNGNNLSRQIIDNFQEKYTAFNNELSYSTGLYQIYKKVSLDKTLDSDQKRVIEIAIKNFDLNGISLPKEKTDQIKKINQELTKLSTTFGDNLNESEKEVKYFITGLETIKDIPADVLEATKEDAKSQGKDGYLFTINNASYLINYCSDAKVREQIYYTLKSLATTGTFDNRENVLNQLKLREQKALLLGYKNFGEYSLSNKMAPSPEFVMMQESEILAKGKIKGEKEYTEIKEYFNLTGINVWDYSYYKRLIQEKKYQVDNNELRNYFEYNKVLKGLFDIANKLYGIEMKLSKIKMYNDDVKAYEVYKDGVLKGYYILDPFYNPNKESGAQAIILRNKKSIGTGERLPILINIINYTKGKDQTLLSYREAQILFHEFGHAMHALLSDSKYSELNGFMVERDFVELPSQMLERWTKGEGLKTFAYHFKTGERISDELIEKLGKLQTFGKGIQIATQMMYSTVDMKIHTIPAPQSVQELDKITSEIIDNTAFFKENGRNKFYAGFIHIFDGGYEAGYYSYLRSEIIESDIFSEFTKNGIFDKVTATKFYKTILSQGTRKPAIELFKDFMGRDVQLDGLYQKFGF